MEDKSIQGVKRLLEDISNLADDILNEDFYYGTKEDKLKLIKAYCKHAVGYLPQELGGE